MNLTEILVTRYGGAGDMIMMEPVLEALYYKHRPAEITLRTHPHYSDLHKFHPLLKVKEGILTANPSAPGFPSDEKKPQGYDLFYNTTGCVELNRGIHGIDSFAFAMSATPLRRTPVLYLDPDVEIVPRDIVVHTPKRSSTSPRNADFRHFDIPELIANHFDKRGIEYDCITAIGAEEEKDHGLQEFAQIIAGARLFVGPDSAGAHIAAALSVPHVVAYTSDFPAGIRAYPQTVSTRDGDMEGFLTAVEAAYMRSWQVRLVPRQRVAMLSEKYAYGRICDVDTEVSLSDYKLIQRCSLTLQKDWRQEIWNLVERLATGGVLFLYERHKRRDPASSDPLMVVKYLIQNVGLDVLDYSATADSCGYFHIAAQKVKRPEIP